MSITAASLIDEIQNLLQSSEPLSERISRLTQYSNGFEEWYREHEGNLEQENGESEAEKLLELHNQLISQAEGWLKEAGTKLGMQKKKGKGIMAYADILPKRVSRYRTKKG